MAKLTWKERTIFGIALVFFLPSMGAAAYGIGWVASFPLTFIVEADEPRILAGIATMLLAFGWWLWIIMTALDPHESPEWATSIAERWMR